MKIVAALFCFLVSFAAMACPFCAGNNQGGKDNNTTIVLGLFILAIYIPYIVIYRLIKKSREIHAAQEPKV